MDKPNIILINCDDLGYGDLGCYGSTVHQTPAIDRLAAEGTRLTSFYMASAVCSPSRCAMMTGCYPPRISCGEFEGRGVLFPGQGVGLNPEETTIPKLLKDAGYATALIGKWHCGDQPEFLPTRHGFDHYYGLPYSNDMGIQKVRPDVKNPLPLMRDEEVIQEQPEQESLTERYVEESVRFIRDNRDGPFFLYLAHMYVHRPLLVPERFLAESGNGPYGGAVQCIDWAMDVLLKELDRLGLAEDTLIIFTSDNGSKGESGGNDGGSNLPLRGHKAQTFEGGIRVPCILRWPGKIPAARVEQGIFSAIDFLPTFGALASAGRPSEMIDGLDGSSWLLGEETASPRDTFAYYAGNRLSAVRKGPWKLMHTSDDEQGNKRVELYHLDHDIAESVNRYDDEPEVVRDLELLWRAVAEDIGDSVDGIAGRNIRPIGRVANPKTLTEYDPEHPYMIASYDGDTG